MKGNPLIHHGDCIEVMADMEPNSIDAIVCDPPYGLEFMGKEWDAPHKAWDKRKAGGYADGSKTRRGPQYTAGYSFQSWVTQWATEALRVLKPGGSLLSFGGTRTFHRLTCGLEDSGFTIKDCLMWLYGQGFPKAQDLGKMIDKRAGVEREVVGENPNNRPNRMVDGKRTTPNGYQTYEYDPLTAPASDLARHWDGYKIGGIKPAWEPIIWCVKKPEGAWTDNVLKYGTGAVNVDECRIHTNDDLSGGTCGGIFGQYDEDGNRKKAIGSGSKGRFPANLLLSHTPECVRNGVKRVKPSNGSGRCSGNTTADKSMFGMMGNPVTYADPDGLETVENWSCHPDCPVRLLDEQSGVLSSGNLNAGHKYGNSKVVPYGGGGDDKTVFGNYGGDTGGASRFFYCAKASKRESYNDHPTLKPVKLIEYLVRLVTRPGQLVLDPFAGSGTTGVACIKAGREFLLIEQDEHYCEIAERRTTEGAQDGMF